MPERRKVSDEEVERLLGTVETDRYAPSTTAPPPSMPSVPPASMPVMPEGLAALASIDYTIIIKLLETKLSVEPNPERKRAIMRALNALLPYAEEEHKDLAPAEILRLIQMLPESLRTATGAMPAGMPPATPMTPPTPAGTMPPAGAPIP